MEFLVCNSLYCISACYSSIKHVLYCCTIGFCSGYKVGAPDKVMIVLPESKKKSSPCSLIIMGKLGGVGGRGERTIIFGVFNCKEDGSWSKNPLSLSLSLSLSILKGGREGGQDDDMKIMIDSHFLVEIYH